MVDHAGGCDTLAFTYYQRYGRVDVSECLLTSDNLLLGKIAEDGLNDGPPTPMIKSDTGGIKGTTPLSQHSDVSESPLSTHAKFYPLQLKDILVTSLKGQYGDDSKLQKHSVSEQLLTLHKKEAEKQRRKETRASAKSAKDKVLATLREQDKIERKLASERKADYPRKVAQMAKARATRLTNIEKRKQVV